MKHVVFELSYELLCEFLDLPEGTRIIGIRDMSFATEGVPTPSIAIKVEHPDFPDIEEAGRLPVAIPTYKDEWGGREFQSWNLPPEYQEHDR